MGVSENSGFSPQIIHFNRVCHYKPSILRYPYFWKHSDGSLLPPKFETAILFSGLKATHFLADDFASNRNGRLRRNLLSRWYTCTFHLQNCGDISVHIIVFFAEKNRNKE